MKASFSFRLKNIDPNSDLARIKITVRAGSLNNAKKRIAVNRALQRAEVLVRHKIITGALIAMNDVVAVTNEIGETLNLERRKET